MHRGYTKRWRKRWDNGYHTDPLLWVLMDWFIDHANHEKKKRFFFKGETVIVERGQRIFSQPELARFFKVGRRQIRTRLITMQNIGFLTIQTTKRYSIATVINYDKYQPTETHSRPSERPTPDQHPTINNNYNNYLKNKELNLYTDKGAKKIKIPDWLDKESWNLFKEHRRRIRKPMTDYAQKLQIKQLERVMERTGKTSKELIDYAIMRSWQGLDNDDRWKNFDSAECERRYLDG